MRCGVAVLITADAVETQIGHMMLATGIEAAAYLDAQVADCLVAGQGAFGQANAQLARQSTRRGNAEFAGVGAGARDRVENRSRARLVQSGALQILVERRQVRLAYPAQHDVLLHRSPHGFIDVGARDSSQGPQLIGGNVAQRQSHGHGRVTGLALRVNVARAPFAPVLGLRSTKLHKSRWTARRLLLLLKIGKVRGPTRVEGQDGPLFQHQPLEFVQPQFHDQELHAGRIAVLLFA